MNKGEYANEIATKPRTQKESKLSRQKRRDYIHKNNEPQVDGDSHDPSQEDEQVEFDYQQD